MKPVAYIPQGNLADLTRENGTICGVTVYKPGYQPYSSSTALYVLTPEQLQAAQGDGSTNERMRRALHEIAEEWAGAECGEPVHAQEAYAIGLAKRMYELAVEGLAGLGQLPPIGEIE